MNLSKVIPFEVYEAAKKKVEEEEAKKRQKSYFIEKQFIPAFLGEDIIENHFKMYNDGTQLYFYDSSDGYYKPDGERMFKKKAYELLGSVSYTPSRVKNALESVLDSKWEMRMRKKFNNNHDIINVKNGLLNWRTGELLPHTDEYLSTVQLAVIYDPDANEPIVMQFLQDVLDSKETIDAVLEFIGYCLTPLTKYHKALMLTGSGANGKSVLIDTIQTLIGLDHVSNVSLQDLSGDHRFTVAQLENKLLNAFSDIPHKGLENTSTFKTIVRGERLSAEYKGKQLFNFEPFAKMLFAANELPASRDLTNGFFRSWLVVKFNRTFQEHEQDRNLINKLTTEKTLSTLFNLALKGLKRLEKNGKFTESESMQMQMEKYKKDIDSVASFIDECCELPTDKDDQSDRYKVNKKSLFQSYQRFCETWGLKSFGRNRFNENLVSNYGLQEIRSADERFWQGIHLKKDDFADSPF